MKLSLNTTKLTSLKSNALRALAAATLAGAFLTAATPTAQAQRIAVGVRFGGPVYGPRYYAPLPPVRVYGGPVYAYGYGYPYGWRHDDWRFRHEHFYGYRR